MTEDIQKTDPLNSENVEAEFATEDNNQNTGENKDGSLKDSMNQSTNVKPPLTKPQNAYWVWGLLAVAALASIIFALSFVSSVFFLMAFYIYWRRSGYSGKNNIGILVYTFLGISYLMQVKEQGLEAENSIGFLLFGIAFCGCTALLVYAKRRYTKWSKAQELIEEKQESINESDEEVDDEYDNEDVDEGDNSSVKDSIEPIALGGLKPENAQSREDYLQVDEEEEYEEDDDENLEYLNYEHPYDGASSLYPEDLSHPYEENDFAPKASEGGKRRVVISRKGERALLEGESEINSAEDKTLDD